MGVNSLPKTVTRQRRDCDLNPGPSAPESSTLSTWHPSHLGVGGLIYTISYDNLTTLLKLRPTYDGRLIYKTKLFLGTIHLFIN